MSGFSVDYTGESGSNIWDSLVPKARREGGIQRPSMQQQSPGGKRDEGGEGGGRTWGKSRSMVTALLQSHFCRPSDFRPEVFFGGHIL
jgi:hypothetical protein